MTARPSRPTLAEALALATTAHQGMVDLNGCPYILHPVRVMQRGQTPAEQLAGILHDVLEDTTVTREQLQALGYPADLLTTLIALTRHTDESYMAFIRRASQDPVARWVKLYDLEDNMDLRRYTTPSRLSETILSRIARYHHAWGFLRKVLSTSGWTHHSSS